MKKIRLKKERSPLKRGDESGENGKEKGKNTKGKEKIGIQERQPGKWLRKESKIVLRENGDEKRRNY